jgi:hypothetical protein
LRPTDCIGNSFGDCVESAIRTLVNAVVLDPVRLVFDVSRVSGNARPIQGLLEFYNGTNTNGVQRNIVNSEISSRESSQAWYDLVSNIEGVMYKRIGTVNERTIRYEIIPDILNVVKALNHLFGKAKLQKTLMKNFSRNYGGHNASVGRARLFA